MALAAKEAARRAAARVSAAETAVQEQRDNALRAQAQLDLLRDLHGRAANHHAGPAGGSAGSGSSAPPAAPPSLFNTFLSSARPDLTLSEMQGEVRRLQDREEERARGTHLRSPEAIREDKAWVQDQTHWGQVARSLQDHFQAQGAEVPADLQSAVNAGESNATQSRQTLRLVERHGPRVAAEFTGTPLLSTRGPYPAAHHLQGRAPAPVGPPGPHWLRGSQGPGCPAWWWRHTSPSRQGGQLGEPVCIHYIP